MPMPSVAKRCEALRSSYIGYLDPVTLTSQNKLRLNRNNDTFYRDYLVPLQTMPQRGLKTSEKRLRNCFLWFVRQLETLEADGETLATFIEHLVTKLFFTVIKVSDELNAYRVFETLNARGVQLSSADLLKNYLFSVIHRETNSEREFQELERRWGQIMDTLRSESFADFLRVYWNSRHETVRKNQLFKVIREEIREREEVFTLIRELDSSADVFVALKNPEDELWTPRPKVRKWLRALKLFRVKQQLPLLLSAYETLSENEFLRLLRFCVVLLFRYTVISGLHPNEHEKVYNQIALRLRRGKQDRIRLADIQRIYIDEDTFRSNFANKSLPNTSRNKKLIRYILGELEKEEQSAFDSNDPQLTVEHILPENPGSAWEAIDDETWERSVYLLGNLTLLEKPLNKQATNADFSHKKAYYKQSGVVLTQKLEQYDEWIEDSIRQRQQELAKRAVQVWRLD